MPATHQLAAIITELIPAKDDANPLVAWPGVEVRRYRGRIYAMAPLPQEPGDKVLGSITPDRVHAFNLQPGAGRLWLVPHEGLGLAAEKLMGQRVEVRYRRGGERIRLQVGGPSRELKTLFQERGVFPWARARVPIIYINGEAAAVADDWLAAGFAAASGAKGMRVIWEPVMPVC